jgi:hypothetical protein
MLDHPSLEMLRAFAAFGAEKPACLRAIEIAQPAIEYFKKHRDDWTGGKQAYLHDHFGRERYSDEIMRRADYQSERILMWANRLGQQADELRAAVGKLLKQMSPEEQRTFYGLRGYGWPPDEDDLPVGFGDDEESLKALPPIVRAAYDLDFDAGGYDYKVRELRRFAHEMAIIETMAMKAQIAARDAIVELLGGNYTTAVYHAEEAASLADLYGEAAWEKYAEVIEEVVSELG